MSKISSYGQILKASSVMGGAAGINLLLGMLRVKVAAVLVGTTGVGLNASFISVQNLIATVAGLGIQSSAVREIAVAVSKNDQAAIGRIVLTLRRLCWLTGLAGMGSMMLLSPLISQLTFGHRDYMFDIAALGLIILFTNLSGGQMALIQGMRRIGDMARANIFGSAFGTIAAIIFYAELRLRGIIPSLIAVAAIQLALSWYYARQVSVPHAVLSWKQTFSEANSMVKLGLVMMTSGLLTGTVSYITVTLITKLEGVQAVGIYSAAYALSGMFVNFVLGAMGADYYPRLTAVTADKKTINRMVNEQTEIGLLLALPGLLATMTLAPWILQIFYTHEFLGAVKLLQWFIFGCMFRVISWPLGFVMLALGKGRWYLFTETGFNLFHVALIALGLKFLGIQGIAVAFFLMYLGYIITVYLVCRHLTDFKWSTECFKIALLALTLLGAIFIVCRTLTLWPASLIGLALTLAVSIYCLRALVIRIGPEHRIVRAITKIPGAKSFLLP